MLLHNQLWPSSDGVSLESLSPVTTIDSSNNTVHNVQPNSSSSSSMPEVSLSGQPDGRSDGPDPLPNEIQPSCIQQIPHPKLSTIIPFGMTVQLLNDSSDAFVSRQLKKVKWTKYPTI